MGEYQERFLGKVPEIQTNTNTKKYKYEPHVKHLHSLEVGANHGFLEKCVRYLRDFTPADLQKNYLDISATSVISATLLQERERSLLPMDGRD